MIRPEQQAISNLADHPDAETLREHDHPLQSLRRWKGILTAKAWLGSDLACFFAGADGSESRIVLFFKSSNAYLPACGGEDMREAAVACLYELDVFVTEHHLPIIDRVERMRSFP